MSRFGRRNARRNNQPRNGSILVFALFSLVLIFVFVAFAIDIGQLVTIRSQMQNSADASARAAARHIPEDMETVEEIATTVAEKNRVNFQETVFFANDDLDIGIWDFDQRRFTPLSADRIDEANAARTTIRIGRDRGNSPLLFFARMIGVGNADFQTQAIAAIGRDVIGFRSPPENQTHPILPFTVDLHSWNEIEDEMGPDHFGWNEGSQSVEAGGDGIPEINLFPEGNHAPGNRGYLEFGANGGKNSTLDRQIRDGLNQSDFDYHGGSLELDGGSLTLGGKPGVRASLKTAFNSVLGEVRVIPVFEQVTGSGNNTQYSIVKWVGVRVVHVDFSGSPKQVLVQPADVWLGDGAITGSDADETSRQVFIKPKLVD